MLQEKKTPPVDTSHLPVACSFEEYECDRLGTLMRAVKAYGPIFRCGKYMIFVNDPLLIEQILLTTNQQFLVPAVPFRPDLGENRLADWTAKRHGPAHGLHHKLVFAALPQMLKLIEEQMSHWQPGHKLYLDEEMKRLSYRIVATYFYGPDAEQLLALSRKFVEATVSFIDSPFAFPQWFPQPKRKRMQERLTDLEQAIIALIGKRRAGTSAEETDLLTMLLHTQDKHGNPLSERAICDILVAMIFPSCSVAAGLSWIWFLLTQHPEALRQLQQEASDLLGTRQLQSEDLPHLTYCTSVIKEALRLYPPTWLLERDINADCEIGGYRFAKGQKVFMSPYLVQRDPLFFGDPERFIPERWLDRENSAPRYSYFPFGGGPRICTGTAFSMTVLTVATVALARRFAFRLVGDPTRVRPDPQPFLVPTPSLKVIVEKSES